MINLSKVRDADVSEMKKWFPEKYEKHKINEMNAGIESGEHYKLLHYLSMEVFYKSTILDVGTRDGMSALALGLSRNNDIVSYDILKVEPPFAKDYPRIQFKQLDINKEEANKIHEASLIVLDIDPHDGKQERVFFNKLREIKYKGLVLLDDISAQGSLGLFPEMEKFWNEIPERKWNITKFGHGSGTGLVEFGKSSDRFYEELQVVHNWNLSW